MTREEIKRELGEIERITGAWEDIAAVSEIEKDMVLDKLKKLYGEIKFPVGKEEAAPVYDMPVIDMEDSPVSEPEPVPVMQAETPRQAREVEVPTPVQEPAPAAEEVAGEPVAAADPQFADVPAGHERELFRPDEVSVRTKFDRKVILSLYGEDDTPDGLVPEKKVTGEPAAEQKEVAAEPVAVPEPAVPQEPAPRAAAYSETTVRETVISEQHTVVLGEVMKNGEETIADVYAKQNHTTDMASKIVSDQTSGLRKSIGINDKFLLMRDLFGGDAAAYEQAISDLEKMTGLDDALLYIHDRHWNPNCDGMKMLVELLSRKLS